MTNRYVRYYKVTFKDIMEVKETLSKTRESLSILEDEQYYKYIFKKTEKMSCAVFYILRQGQNIGHKDIVIEDLENGARALLNVSLQSLRSSKINIEQSAFDIRQTLFEFESRLRIANSARIISTEYLEVFVHEIDSVQRSLRQYLVSSVLNPVSSIHTSTEPARERRMNRMKIGTPSLESNESDKGTSIENRRDRVLRVLKDKGEATIKDIIEVVTDCSEKTIQRELINLIKDTLVVREGERRWSRYRLI